MPCASEASPVSETESAPIALVVEQPIPTLLPVGTCYFTRTSIADIVYVMFLADQLAVWSSVASDLDNC